ncbi:ethanolamine utilization protein EutJ [Clostridium kluyveri]|uniref:ethanolamine utilization protein EutJ n=1 Tax=Clostridium kluyveri TaxID=1534 RepID=UPI0022450493|nr:ethanolamine utilization protein EutJ [Clostridium kluyveri]UZQ51757.1 ethanolamine utilization protein EutJ [Clostridium kluyveri]
MARKLSRILLGVNDPPKKSLKRDVPKETPKEVSEEVPEQNSKEVSKETSKESVPKKPAKKSILDDANAFIMDMEKVMKKPRAVGKDDKLKVGVDLGTSNIVIAVLDENNKPVAGELFSANVVRDGIVVEYLNAVTILRKLKGKLEGTLNRELLYAATAIPPGISTGNTKVIQNVVEAAEFQVSNVVDEPTAASEVLKIKNGAVVDVGGGTTGISILQDGEVVYSADEPTGGHHLSLVVAGALQMDYEAAEKYKVDMKNYNRVFTLVRPVVEKMADIVVQHIKGFNVNEIYLVGGTCCLKDIEKVFEKYTGIKTIKPHDPLLVTPMGIAMNDTKFS